MDDSGNRMNDDEDLPHPPVEHEDETPPRPGPRVMRSNSLGSEGDKVQEEKKEGIMSPDEEREIIKKLHDFEIQAGAMYHLVESSWWIRWCEWVGFETEEGVSRGSRPTAIDNSPLLAVGHSAKLKSPISERRDFVLILPKAWEHLKSWYGGGPDIVRRSIQQGNRAVVELYGLNLKVFRSDDLNLKPVEINISKASTVRELKEMACSKAGVNHAEVRIWDYFHKKPYALLDTPSKKLETCQIMENNEILIELKSKDGSFVIEKDTDSGASGSYSNYNSSGNARNVVTSTSPPPSKGAVGLENLGNTCFMNSTLQCLSNCPPLAKYFASEEFMAEINRDNPLGHDGKLAESFGALMKLMWPAEGESSASCIAPRAFKYQMGTFRPEFSGYQQHDSSELLNFLLDGLHEDLNRIRQKPYTETVNSDGRPDEVVAVESLSRYKLRNDSKIHELFLGQFKSTLVCPDCGNVSITFDPYSMVSLPLRTAQEEMQQQYRVTFIQIKSGGQRHHQSLKLGIPKGAYAGQLRDALSEAVGIPSERLVIAQMMRSYIYKFFEDNASLDFVKAGTSVLLAYEVEHADVFLVHEEKSYNYYPRYSPQKNPTHDYAAIVMYFRKDEPQPQYSTAYYSRNYPSHVLYGEPVLFNHPRMTSPAKFYEAIADLLGPGVTPEMFRMYVCDTYGKADTEAVDCTDTTDVKNGMKQKLHIVIEWVDKDQSGISDPMDEEPTNSGDQADDIQSDDDQITLERCFELFSSPEKLTKEDAWYCDKCKNHVEATKCMQLWTTPDILVCHLKRFSYSRYYRDKVETPVIFPLENLDLSRFVLSPKNPSNIYHLVGVSNHMGSLGCGHYTASGRSSEDGHWYKFNDSHVSRMSAESVNSGDVYTLFYIRKEICDTYFKRPSSG